MKAETCREGLIFFKRLVQYGCATRIVLLFGAYSEEAKDEDPRVTQKKYFRV